MEQDKKGKFQMRSGFNIVESMNPYSYTGNNPVKYTDPSGMILDDVVKASHFQQKSSRLDYDYKNSKLGNGNTTIYNEGCVLTTIIRIANAVNGNDAITPEYANEIAKDAGLFTKTKTGQDGLSTENQAKLLSILRSRYVSVESIDGNNFSLSLKLNELDASGESIFVTGRLDNGHTVNINDSLSKPAIFAGIDQPLVDTSRKDRLHTGKEEGYLNRIDIFKFGDSYDTHNLTK